MTRENHKLRPKFEKLDALGGGIASGIDISAGFKIFTPLSSGGEDNEISYATFILIFMKRVRF